MRKKYEGWKNGKYKEMKGGEKRSVKNKWWMRRVRLISVDTPMKKNLRGKMADEDV